MELQVFAYENYENLKYNKAEQNICLHQFSYAASWLSRFKQRGILPFIQKEYINTFIYSYNMLIFSCFSYLLCPLYESFYSEFSTIYSNFFHHIIILINIHTIYYKLFCSQAKKLGGMLIAFGTAASGCVFEKTYPFVFSMYWEVENILHPSENCANFLLTFFFFFFVFNLVTQDSSRCWVYGFVFRFVVVDFFNAALFFNMAYRFMSVGWSIGRTYWYHS